MSTIPPPETPESLAKCLSIASAWLETVRNAFERKDADAFADCFEPEGWFRDLLTFSWDFRTLHGREAIVAYVAQGTEKEVITRLRLEEDSVEGRPHAGRVGARAVVEAALWFETSRAKGRGYVRIPLDHEGPPRAFALMMMVDDWKGHEEMSYELGIYDGHNLAWEEVQVQRRREIEADPDVLIVGGGQTGLNIAARFRQMNIKAIVIEKNDRIGDNWKHRYPSLKLHTPRKHHTLLYQPYPSNWPEFTPKDKMASWLAQYADNNDLVVWLRTTLEPSPTYDAASQRWAVTVIKDGERLTLRPAHLVMAAGFFGDPNVPALPGQEVFQGEILHSSAFPGGDAFKGKRVVVLGAGNSSADICQDLILRGNRDAGPTPRTQVTMIQRSASGVVSHRFNAIQFGTIYPEWRSLEYSDLAAFALPVNALRVLMKGLQPFAREFDKDVYEGLAKGGFKTTVGPDGSGQLLMVYERGGGYYVDFGFWKLIADGDVKVVHGNVSKLTANSVVLDDGTELDADAVVLATGWHPIREKYREIFGSDVVDRTSELWGVDEGGEIRGGFKPSGYPGLWYALGGFEFSRFYSKQLALFIKAQELVYYP